MSRWTLNKEMFGGLWPLIEDENITDIDWDGNSLWVSSIIDGTKRVEINGIDENFVNTFSHYVANNAGSEFNQVENVLSSETDTLRITFVHESLATSGRCFSIRKSMPKLRFTATEALQSGYCSVETMHFLVNAVKIHSNFAFCGEPGTGKTECAKFFSTFIKDNEKVITVEDTLEWHYKYINPQKRADEIKVNDTGDYTKAIKVALRLNPSWLMLSEARSTEVQYLLEGWSTGVHGMTTIHTGKVDDIPDRITNMIDKSLDLERVTNNVYSFLNIGVLMKRDELPDGTITRHIDQVGIFHHTEAGNVCESIVSNGKLYKEKLPDWMKAQFVRNGIKDPFYSEELAKRLEDENGGIRYGFGQGDISYLDHRSADNEKHIDTSEIDIENVMSIINDISRG